MHSDSDAEDQARTPSVATPAAEDLPEGTMVRLHSLVSRQELNGQCGHIMFACCEQSKGRVGVFVSGRAQPLALKLENVEPIPTGATVVTIGTSSLASEEFVQRVCEMVNESYGCERLDCEDVLHRLAMGDDAEQANRVLHLAWRDGALVGCCSSTLAVRWAPRGCGHWGLLVVDEAYRGTGVASALVAAAEHRLREAGLGMVQIEYDCVGGDSLSERLHRWYEGKLGFVALSARPPPSEPGEREWRSCRKQLST